jgi:hypothetical protein
MKSSVALSQDGTRPATARKSHAGIKDAGNAPPACTTTKVPGNQATVFRWPIGLVNAWTTAARVAPCEAR